MHKSMTLRQRHAPPRQPTSRMLDVYLASSTPFMGAVNRTLKNLNKARAKHHHSTIRVYGLGRAIQLALAVAMELRERGHTVEVRTVSLEALDEEIDEEQGHVELKSRQLSGIELKIHALS